MNILKIITTNKRWSLQNIITRIYINDFFLTSLTWPIQAWKSTYSIKFLFLYKKTTLINKDLNPQYNKSKQEYSLQHELCTTPSTHDLTMTTFSRKQKYPTSTHNLTTTTFSKKQKYSTSENKFTLYRVNLSIQVAHPLFLIEVTYVGRNYGIFTKQVAPPFSCSSTWIFWTNTTTIPQNQLYSSLHPLGQVTKYRRQLKLSPSRPMSSPPLFLNWLKCNMGCLHIHHDKRKLMSFLSLTLAKLAKRLGIGAITTLRRPILIH